MLYLGIFTVLTLSLNWLLRNYFGDPYTAWDRFGPIILIGSAGLSAVITLLVIAIGFIL